MQRQGCNNAPRDLCIACNSRSPQRARLRRLADDDLVGPGEAEHLAGLLVEKFEIQMID